MIGFCCVNLFGCVEGFLPAWQELQLRGLPAASPWPAAPASFQTPGFPVAPVATGTAPAAAAAPVAPVHGLIFPGELTNEKEKRRKQQQEMQSALAEQIKEQRAKKEQQKWLASASEAEATHLKYGTPRQGQNTTSFQPLHPAAQGEEASRPLGEGVLLIFLMGFGAEMFFCWKVLLLPMF